jgi:hypothetical protein
MSWSSQIPGGRCCRGGGRSAPRSAIAVSAESSPPLRRRPSPRETRSAHAGRTTSCRTTPLAHEEGRRAPALSPSSQLFTTPATMQDVDQYYVPDSQDPAFADGFRDLSGRAVARAAAGGRRVPFDAIGKTATTSRPRRWSPAAAPWSPGASAEGSPGVVRALALAEADQRILGSTTALWFGVPGDHQSVHRRDASARRRRVRAATARRRG